MYCSQCGQAAVDYRRSFGHVIGDLLDSFLNWDSKFIHTIGLLITRPWGLTNEFLAGRRVRYLHPARLYLLTSILFFFAVTSWIKSIHIDPINLSPAQRAEIRSELERDNVAPEVRAKIEAALGGPAISTEKRSELKAQLKRDDLLEEERSKIEKQLEDDVPPDARRRAAPSPGEASPDDGRLHRCASARRHPADRGRVEHLVRLVRQHG